MTALIVRQFTTVQPYLPVWHAMQAFTAAREPDTPDELWCLEHEPVYTLGQAAQREHLLATGDVTVIGIDRGGQVTWHGPGQWMFYTLLDTRRLGLGARHLVERLQQAVVAAVAGWGVRAYSRPDAPGVYVQLPQGEAKLAALGLRIRQRGCYHGLALNVSCDLQPFSGINPCGYPGMAVTRLADLVDALPGHDVLMDRLVGALARELHYDHIQHGAVP